MICREALLWRQLCHPHILPFLGVDNETFAWRSAICLVSPMMERGTLRQYVASTMYTSPGDRDRLVRTDPWPAGLLPLTRAAPAARDCAGHRISAWTGRRAWRHQLGAVRVSLVHSRATHTHTQANIFVDNWDRAQIADFGMAVVSEASASGSSATHAGLGTVAWMSPERIIGTGTRLAPPMDVYSFGILWLTVRLLSRRRVPTPLKPSP
jgi:serine/threonine protein kinase